MFSLDDDRWTALEGAYRLPFDLRPLLRQLENDENTEAVWNGLWNELHHQGDVGVASYAAVPHLVRIYLKCDTPDWNTYALVATIDLARSTGKNPQLPDWLQQEYDAAIDQLAQKGLTEMTLANGAAIVQSILSVLAVWKGVRTYARFLLNFSEEELLDMEDMAFHHRYTEQT